MATSNHRGRTPSFKPDTTGMPGGDRLTPDQAASYLGVTPNTLKAWRLQGTVSLPFRRYGGSRNSKVIYLQTDLDAFMDSCKEGVA